MAGFELDGDVVVLRLDGQERTVLASLAAGLIEMLAEGVASPSGGEADADPLAAMVGMSTAPVEPPSDPALKRLLPDAYADEESAAEFRRLTDADARVLKTANLQRILDGCALPGGVVRIPPNEVDGWLAGVNDIRLVLGERLEMTEEREHLEDIEAGDPRLPLLAAYDWLSMVQELMVEMLMEGLD